MTELVTLDSSVVVAALRKEEEHNQTCLSLLAKVKDGTYVAVEPYTVLVEIAAAIRRRTGSQELSERVIGDILSLDTVFFLELDDSRAKQAVEVAQRSGVRGMDAIVVQIAKEFNATLVSLDNPMMERVTDLVKVKRPVEV